MMRAIRLLVAFTSAGISLSQTKEDRPAAVRSVTVCEALSAPLKYNGQMVVIRGRVEGTDEGAWLIGDGCAGVFVTAGYVWPSVISLATPTIPAPLRIHQIDFTFDWESQRKIGAKTAELRKSAPPECLEFTYTGLFETREDWSNAKMHYQNGTSRYAGFGHLGDAPVQLVLKSEDDVTVSPNCKRGENGIKK